MSAMPLLWHGCTVIKLYESYAWLYKKYVQENRKIEDIAKEAGVSKITIRRYLKKHGLI